ncbi:MAG: ABC transporter permease [Candidatus Pacearchaeota archaeon]
MVKDYFSLAFENLKHRGLRSWLTILGIFIGIAAVVSLISLGSGLQNAIVGQFATLSIDVLTIQNAGTGFGPPGSTVVKKLNEHDLNIVESTDGIKIAVPRLIRVTSVEYNNVKSFKYIGSIPKNKNQRDFIYKEINLKTEQGRLLNENDRGRILLGNDFLGEEFGKTIRIGSKVLINGKEFEVTGILAKTSTFTINNVIMMPEDDMKDLLGIGNEIDLIVAQVEDKNKIEEVALDLERRFRKDRGLKEGEEDFSIQTPLQALESVNTILNVINIVIIGIAAISLLVGAIGITNTMYTSVLERTKEIGIMKAIGAKNQDILFIFLIESGLLGLVGGIIGAIIGLWLAYLVSQIAGSLLGSINLKISVSYPLLLGAVLFSFLIGILSGILPALQASRLKPVEALRK